MLNLMSQKEQARPLTLTWNAQARKEVNESSIPFPVKNPLTLPANILN